MSLRKYFSDLLERVEKSEAIHNGGRDENGFYHPTRTVVIRNLSLLRDLHDKHRAHQMVKAAWKSIVSDLPPEWLVMETKDQAELARILSDLKDD